jgi:hypothetical protein
MRWREAARHSISRFRRLFPAPFAGLRVEVGGTAFDHLVAESGARHEERHEIATAKAECAEPHHDDELQQLITHGNNSDNFAILTAILRASSRVSILAANLRRALSFGLVHTAGPVAGYP